MLTLIVRSVFDEDDKFYSQIYLDECFCMSYKDAAIRKNLVSEGIGTNKTSASKECMLCRYWYFKDVGFKYEPHVCNKCHDVLMTAYELKNIAILNVKGVDFRCILWGISTDEAVNWLFCVGR